MAKELKFPVRRTARFSQETDDQLVAEAKKRNSKKPEPSIVIRELVEQGLENLKSKEDKSE